MTTSRSRQHGTSLIEVLVTVVIMAFGLLGIAIFQAKAQVGSIEAYQRAQAVILLEDLHARMTANAGAAPAYVTSAPLGTGDSIVTDCGGEAPGTARDRCEWSLALRGAAELRSGANVGAMTGARGCITEIQAPNPATGVCLPGIYQLTVAWQGMHATRAPAQACGRNLYGDDTHRRAISVRISVGLPTCASL